MPKFNDASKGKLLTCHDDLQTLFNKVVESWDCTILEGFRGKEAQNAAFESGHSKLKFPNGKHNKLPSLAVDVSPYPVPNWANQEDFIYFAGYVLGVAKMLKEQGKMTHDIRYGGDFNSNKRISDSSFKDLVHFELVE